MGGCRTYPRIAYVASRNVCLYFTPPTVVEAVKSYRAVAIFSFVIRPIQRVAHALLGFAAHVGRISVKKRGACENAKLGGLR